MEILQDIDKKGGKICERRVGGPGRAGEARRGYKKTISETLQLLERCE